MLQSGELWNTYEALLGYTQDALRDFAQIEESAITAPGRDVARQAAMARDRLAFAVNRAKAITHPAVVDNFR